MKQFYELYKDNEKVSPLVTQLSWTNHLKIMSACKTMDERIFYMNMCIKERLSKRELERQIDSGYYERYMLSQKPLTPAIEESKRATENIFLDNYVLDFLDVPVTVSEHDLQKSIIHNLKDFILEIGKDFTFIGEEYRVQVGNHDYYIDLLFYHRGFSCLVAFELKIGEFKPEYIGKINLYLEALDREVKKENENPSVGVILCASKDDEVETIINRITSLYWDSERHLGLLFMLFTGVRVGELATLKTFDFLLGGKLHIQRTISKAKDESGKSHRIISDFPKTPTSDSIVYLSDDAMTVYQQVMKLRKEKGIISEFLFSEKRTYIADTIFDKTMRKLCTELDIPVRSCHKLRKTYCSELLDLGISEKIVQNQMRHADIATTKGHYYFSTKKEAAIKEALNRNNKLCVNI